MTGADGLVVFVFVAGIGDGDPEQVFEALLLLFVLPFL